MSHGDDYDDYGDYGGHGDYARGNDLPPPQPGTRTRYAEGQADGLYGDTPRRGGAGRGGRAVSPSRGAVTVVGVVVLLIAAIAFANRGGGGGGADDGADGGEGGTGTQPTAPTGERPVEGSNGGIPAGFAKTEEGAQSAAANYSVMLVSEDILRPDDRDAIVESLFVSSKTAGLQQKFDDTYTADFLDKLGLDEDGNAPSGLTYISRTTPVGTKVTEYGGDSASLEVWCTGVYGMAGEGSDNPVTDDWFTLNLDLSWESGDWKVQGFSQKEGPAPVNGDQRASAADEIAEAVEEYGGFTYAR